MKQISKLIVLIPLAFITFVSLYSCTSPPIAFTYISKITVTDLGRFPTGKNSTARDINDGGYIVGSSDTTSSGDRRAFVIHGLGMTSLGTLPGGGESDAHGISENGSIVGAAFNSAGVRHGFFNRLNIMRDLGAFPPENGIGSHSYAYAVSDSHFIVGFVGIAGVVWNLSGTPNFPPFPPFTRVTDPGSFRPAVAFDINNSGQVAGTLLSEAVGFRWSSGTIENLQTLGAADDDAYGINNLGHVVGKALLAPPVRYHAVLWKTPSTIRDLGTLGGTNSSAQDINDNGVVVGYSETASGDTHAFIWRSDLGMRSLGTLGGNNSKAFAINSSGVIVGESETASGETHATRWNVTIGRKAIIAEKFKKP